MKNFDLATLLAGIIPVMLAAMWWVISNVNDLRGEIQLLQANMMMLVDPQGQIIPSPGNAFARTQMIFIQTLKLKILNQVLVKIKKLILPNL